MIRKIIGITICFIAITAKANAQFGIGLDGGLQGMQYSIKNGQAKLLPAGSLGLNYTFRLSSQLDFLTGISAGLYRTQVTLQDGKTFSYGAVDAVGSAFQYRLKFTGFEETQRFIAAGIPLLLQYHTGGDGMEWYIDGGAKLFIPFNANSQISARQVDLTGYYPDFNVELSDLPQHGFGTLKNWESTGTLKLKPAAALSAGTGLIFKLSSGKSLYAGLFVDYGLTSLKDDKDNLPIITYSPKGTNGTQSNSVLNTEYAGKAALLSYGMQIRLSFGHSRSKPVVRHDTATQSQTAATPATTSPTSGLNDDEAAIVDEPVVFGIVGETSIPELQKPQLDRLIDLLKQHPNIHLSVIGHYCNSERTMENKKIGEARAKAVARYLQKKGISRNRLTAAAAGEADPVLLSDPAANYQSRRVAFAVARF